MAVSGPVMTAIPTGPEAVAPSTPCSTSLAALGSPGSNDDEPAPGKPPDVHDIQIRKEHRMTTEPFAEFLATTRPAAASAYVTGDAAPVTSMSTRRNPASFFGPSGGSVTGADAVIETNEAGAAMFEVAGETRLEVLHSGHDGDLAYWVGVQHATVHMAGRDEPVPMKLRITELFRYEDDGWKLVHRHADPYADADGH